LFCAVVRALLDLVALAWNDDAGAQPEEPVEPAHPLRIASREVVVDGHDVDALAFETVQVAGERGD